MFKIANNNVTNNASYNSFLLHLAIWVSRVQDIQIFKFRISRDSCKLESLESLDKNGLEVLAHLAAKAF